MRILDRLLLPLRAGRPGVPVQGEVQYNSSTGVFESYDGANWHKLSPVAIQTGGTAFSPLLDTPGQNTTGFLILLWVRCGITPEGAENGHIYLEIAPNNNGGSAPVTGWQTVDALGVRNNMAAGTGAPAPGPVADGGPGIGIMRGLHAPVPNTWWYRLRTMAISGYTNPDYVLDGATPGYFSTFG